MSNDPTDISREFATERAALFAFILRRVNERDTSEVILQTTFERATHSLQEKSSNSIRALLYVIARNLLTDHYRQKGFRSQFWSEGHDVETEVTDIQNPERSAIAQERLKMAADVIRGLPDKCRHAFVENRFKHRSVEDIANELSLSKSMVKKYIQKAITTIKEELARREN